MTNVTSRQKKHVTRIMEDALDATQSDYDLAREILGDDFISPEEIATARGLNYSAEQIAELERTFPNKETLEWVRRNKCYLVAGSPSEMSLLDVHELKREYFYARDSEWYTKLKESFARNEKITCRWYMLRKGIVPNSTNQSWSDQKQLLSDFELVPSVAEMVWGLTTYKAVKNACLLPSVYVRTSSVDSEGHHVVVGNLDNGRFNVKLWGDGGSCGYLGVASARKVL